MKKKRRDPHLDSEDMFADTRMTLGGHIEDLRSHLLRAIYGFAIGMVFGLIIGNPVLQFIIMPVQDQLMEYWKRYYAAQLKKMREDETSVQRLQLPKTRLRLGDLAQRLNLPKEFHPKDPDEVMLLQPDLREFEEWYVKFTLELKPPTPATMSVTEAFVVYVKVSMLTGLVVSSPWVFYQIWAFIAAGLFPHEKRLVNVYLPYSLGLFLIGVFVCELFVIPKAVGALLWFNEWLGLEPDLRLNEWLGFAILMPVVFGVSFQTPLVMLFTEKIGVFDVATFRSYRRAAYFVMFAIAMIIIPAMDAVSMLLLAIPMCLLYEFGILLCVWQPRSEFDDVDSDESQEMIEA